MPDPSDDLKDPGGIQHQRSSEIPPPPPYSTKGATASTAAQGSTTYPVQAYHMPVPECTFAVEYADWKGKGLRVLDKTNGTNTLAYTGTIQLRKPQLAIQKIPSSYTDIENNVHSDTAAFHTLSCKIDMLVHGAAFTLLPHIRLHARFTYTSPNHPMNARLKWKSRTLFKAFDFDCTSEEDGVLVARFSAANWSIAKVGQLEIFGQHVADNPKFVDEVVVVALALAHYSLSQAAAVSIAA
ncbi:hypothetical protein A1O1_05134 [Capronia coronata CBS 617.96]|uniref:Uncharacterized protein n=1 Tax=Capronia coronata CBS 617.96 TaxID=1182541 RepID=W9Z0Z8_9EURO|nr:uncharacterized protein A1O1_05134 [Capronia coronata CBS 617.96]EXJ88204.1 hypothetical protein A1O1_05134 [Capronia coronata CBS 617.96]